MVVVVIAVVVVVVVIVIVVVVVVVVVIPGSHLSSNECKRRLWKSVPPIGWLHALRRLDLQ